MSGVLETSKSSQGLISKAYIFNESRSIRFLLKQKKGWLKSEYIFYVKGLRMKNKIML
jgi:hypothetical protein